MQFECKVKDVIFTGNEGGAGNLIVCEVVKIHISEDVLADDGTRCKSSLFHHSSRVPGRMFTHVHWAASSNRKML